MQAKYEDYLRNEKCMRERSIQDYLSAYRLIANKVDPLRVSTYKEVNDRIREIKEERNYSQGSIYKFAICVQFLFKWLHREGYRADNPYPFSEWRKARPSSPKFLTESQFEAIMCDPHLSHQESTLLWLFWDSGARLSEVTQLEQSHFDLERGLVNIHYEITKGNYSFRHVPLSKTCIEHLKRQFEFVRRMGHPKAVFISNDNKPMTINGIGKRVATIGLRQSPLRDSIRLSPHMFRHSVGIRWINKGVPQVIVQKWLGHQSLAMTSRYVNMNAELSREIFQKYLEA